MDVFDELEGGFVSEKYPSEPVCLLPQYGHRYSAPRFRDAFQIWNECSFQLFEYSNIIELGLQKWALEKRYMCSENGTFYWTSASGVRYASVWPTFVKWFFLQCTRDKK